MKFSMRGSFKKNYGGGGGQQAPVETIPEWARPAIQKVQAEASGLYDQGALDNVSGPSGIQQKAFNMADTISGTGNEALGTLAEQQNRLKSMAATGGADELKDALALDIGMSTANLGNTFGSTGTLGSARHALATATSGDAAKAKFAQQVIQNKAAAEDALGKSVSGSTSTAAGTAGTLGKLGSEQRTIEQQQADAPYQALQRYSSTVYGNPARQQAVAGGK
jgi:hypothetical protein